MSDWYKSQTQVPSSSDQSVQADTLFTDADFPPLPTRRVQIEEQQVMLHVSTVEEERSSECTEGLDPFPTGNSFPSSSTSADTVEVKAQETAIESITQDLPVAPYSSSETEDGIQAPQSTHPMITRQKSGIRKPNPRYALMTHKVSYPEPKTVAEALKHPGWTGAMNVEMGNCKEANTWSLVPYTPDMHVLGSKWIFCTKLNADGSLQKLKARLVAQGYNQAEGIDYLETYSPVVRTATVRGVLHLATIMQWDIKQMDVQNAFLHGDLNETVYMRQPAGFVDESRPDHVCHLHKSLYGLKQSPRAWFDEFSTYLMEFGFTCSILDPSLFVYAKGKDVILFLLDVDVMLITGNNSETLASLLAELNKQFKMKDLGQMHYFLGIQAQFHIDGLFLSQQKYAEDLLVAASMSDCAPMPTPLPLQLNKQRNQNQELFSNPTYFRSLAGKLQYLTLTRPDIQFDVNYVCKKMHAPTVLDFSLLKRILRYVKGTMTMGINFRKDSDCTLRAYSDSDWSGCQETRWSTGGYCTYFGLNLISWSSQKQSSVSKSSTEAEYRTLSEAASEIT